MSFILKKLICISILVYLILFDLPRTQLTSIFQGRSTLQNKALFHQNKGHLGSRYLYTSTVRLFLNTLGTYSTFVVFSFMQWIQHWSWNHHPWSAMSIYTFLTPYSHVDVSPKSSILIGFSIKLSILGYPYFWKQPCIYLFSQNIIYTLVRYVCFTTLLSTVDVMSPPPFPSSACIHSFF